MNIRPILVTLETVSQASNGLIEGCSSLEHSIHVGDIADIPSTDILVEGILPLEGSTHIGNGRGVPVANVPVGLDGGSLVRKPKFYSGAEVGVGKGNGLGTCLHPAHAYRQKEPENIRLHPCRDGLLSLNRLEMCTQEE